MADIKSDKSGYWAEQDKDAYLDYNLDWADWLASGDSIANSSWSADTALTLNTSAHNSTITSIWVQGGVPNTWYALVNTVTSAAGRVDQRVIRLFIKNEVDVASAGTALFANRASIIDEIRRDFLLNSQYLSGVQFEDDYLFDKIKAAEGFAQRYIRCYLAPTVIIPDDAPASEVLALEHAGTRFAQESAYDYDPEFFLGEKWGYIVSKQKPIISVQSIKFAYPSPSSQVFEIPSEWIRLDKKYGHIRLVPAAMAFSAPLSAFIMQALGGGRTVPFMIQLRYTAGLTDAKSQYPELVAAVKRLAVVNILKDSFTPQSGSISADGLSQSVSMDIDKYQDSANAVLDTVRDAIHGIRFSVF
jgi:hypothetical protein